MFMSILASLVTFVLGAYAIGDLIMHWRNDLHHHQRKQQKQITPIARRKTPAPESSYEEWIFADTTLTFDEWLARPKRPPELGFYTGPTHNMLPQGGTAQSPVPRPPIGGTGEVSPRVDTGFLRASYDRHRGIKPPPPPGPPNRRTSR